MPETFSFNDSVPDPGPDPESGPGSDPDLSLQDIFENAPIGIFTSTPEGRFLSANPAAAKMFGFETPRELLDAIIDIAAQLYVDPRDREKFKTVLEAEGQVLDQEFRMVRKDGTLFWVNRNARVLRDRVGRIRAYQGFITDISKRKLAEQELRRSENLFRKIFEILPVGLWIADGNGKLQRGNPAGVAIWGAEPQVDQKKYGVFKARRLPTEEEIAPDDWALARTVNKGETIVDELLEIDAFDGEKKIILNYTAPVLDERGNVEAAVVVNRDVTFRYLAEKELQSQRLRLENIINGTNVATWEWNLQTGEHIIDARWAEIVGYTLEELTPVSIQTWENLVHPDDLKNAGELLERHFTGEVRYFDYEYRMRHKDGSWVWVEDRGQIMTRTPEGKPLMIYGTLSDITQRKTMESALKESEERFRLSMEAVSDGVWDWDVRTNHAYYSPGFFGMLGYEAHEIPADVTQWTDLLHPEDKKKALEITQDCIENQAESLTLEFRLKAKDGSWRWILGRGSVLSRDALGRATRLIGTNQDITKLKQVEQALVLAKERAEAANRAKSEFLANMSHEIRTPINGIMGMLQLLSNTALSDKQQHYIQLAASSAERLTRLLSDILDLSQVEAGKMMIRETTFSMEELQDSITGLFSVTARSKGIALECAVDPAISPRLIGDEARVRQVLFNLIGNALKFCDTGKVTVEMAPIRSWKPGAVRILFSVTDTGIGMPENKLRELFEPFTQLDGSHTRKYQGSGLGLAIVKRLIELMDGRLCVESRQGEGTSVYFDLYFKLPDDVALPEDPPAPSVPAPPNLRILLAEDDPSNSYPTVKRLERAGHAVTLAEDGRQALDLLKDRDFDCILMDIQMPVMNGIEAAKTIRSSTDLGPKKDIPIIALTAFAMDGDREKFLEAGMNDYLAKPVLKKDLTKALEKITRGPA
ncbi:PAS domain-containing hybrid sensor histidine kinase/response regulator [Desulfonatronum thiodismutans]|uniref:PAS domain-containing hybrid sensor histidine kinase/response regulator n=1 Tax=Desulfonatronum thiodismutans TaxID=159290 RepID=UPI00068EA9AD|nr:PAS domain S-box protein [Desulfonatronum thiodismutans]